MVRLVLVARLLVAALIVSSGAAFAQTPAGPSGHWEGAIQVPGQEIKIEIDLAETAGKWRRRSPFRLRA